MRTRARKRQRMGMNMRLLMRTRTMTMAMASFAVGWRAGSFGGWLAGWFLGWLAAWLAGWRFDWLLVRWLAGVFVSSQLPASFKPMAIMMERVAGGFKTSVGKCSG